MDLPALSVEIKSRIDAASAVNIEDRRWRLGASEIGDECLRRTWLSYRWIYNAPISGRMRRLFKRGHEEEARISGLLKSIGYNVLSHDPATGRQWAASLLHGHYGGSCDGFVQINTGVGENDPEQFQWALLEAKTHNDKSFKDLLKHGVRKSKLKHYIQACVYGKLFGMHLALYFPVNKNDDDIAPEVIELDHSVADTAERKAEALIRSDEPPPKISKSPAYYICKMCDFHPVCHGNAETEKNCRSCRFAVPTVGGDALWLCKKHNGIIPRDFAAHGCELWRPIV